jgi:membrane protease subunit HflK
LIARVQDFFTRMIQGGPGRSGALLVLAISLVWLGSGFYTIQPNEVGLNIVFGRYIGRTQPGLNYNWPWPIGQVIKPQVTNINALDVGFARTASGAISVRAALPEESLMLTGDQNIADVKFRVIWQIDPAHPEDFVFNLNAPAETIKGVAESVMREIVGRTPIQRLLTGERSQIEPAARDMIQAVMNRYQAGVMIAQVQLLPVDPPASVIASFKDVTSAQQEKDRLQNEAEAYANKAVPVARGNAGRIVQEAEAYRDQTVSQARGQSARFDQIYAEYRKAPEITRRRLYMETMERVLAGGSRVIVDSAQGSGIFPYIPLGLPQAGRNPGETP